VIRLSAPVTVAAAAGDQTPTISGIAVPWDTDAVVSDGSLVRFAAGSLPDDGPAPKLIESHDMAQVRGIVSERRKTKYGMEFTAQIARTTAGLDAIELLKMGALDSVSVGVNPTKWSYDGNTMVIEAGDWVELSLVAVPAFAEAKITQVAATKPDDPTTPPTQEEPPVETTPQVVEAASPAIIPTNPFTEYAQPRRQFRLPTPGEWIAAWRAGGADFAQLNANVVASAPVSPLQAAAGDVTTGEADGILPTPIVGPIFDALNQGRPVVTALGTRAMPANGKVFIRPFIKDRTDVGKQANELAALSTRSFETDDIQITKETFGGRVLLSEQVIDWSEPSMLDAVLNDLAREYAVATEKRVVGGNGSVVSAAMTTAQGEQATNFTAADKFIEAMYSAAGKIAADTGYLPNVLACHPLMWTKIGQLTDNDKRPLFPTLAPSNAPGTSTANAYTSNVLGLTLVVSKEMAGASFFGGKNANEVFVMFNSRNIELYEQQKGAVSVQVPDKLALNLAFRGYFQGVVLEKLGFKVIYTGTL
jgi:HK97 family phage prohead protease/HK97 family phage major capsid protein